MNIIPHDNYTSIKKKGGVHKSQESPAVRGSCEGQLWGTGNQSHSHEVEGRAQQLGRGAALGVGTAWWTPELPVWASVLALDPNLRRPQGLKRINDSLSIIRLL